MAPSLLQCPCKVLHCKPNLWCPYAESADSTKSRPTAAIPRGRSLGQASKPDKHYMKAVLAPIWEDARPHPSPDILSSIPNRQRYQSRRYKQHHPAITRPACAMDFPDFLEQLFAEGRVAVAMPADFSTAELQSAQQVLNTHDEIVRLDLPDDIPPLDPPSAAWAGSQFYRGCQLAMFRDIGEEAIIELANKRLGITNTAAVHYSVDLTFRYLPDLARIARSVATDDPLVALLM